MKGHTIPDVKQGQSDAFMVAARRLGRFINALDLNADAHDELVDLICEQLSVVERDAFTFGYDTAVKLMHYYYGSEEE